MYSQSTQAGASEETGPRRGRRTGKQEESGRRERVRLVQLLACLALFLTVFIGKGVFPQRLDQLGEDILALIGSNTDFRAAFSDLGESLAEQDSVLGDIGEFCIQVFGSGQDSGGEASPALAGGVEEESRFLNSRPDMAELTAHYLRLDRVPDSWLPGEQAEGEAAQQTPQAQTAAPAVGTVLLKANYNGPELPANYTMDQISLGDLETVTPVFGPLCPPTATGTTPLTENTDFTTEWISAPIRGTPFWHSPQARWSMWGRTTTTDCISKSTTATASNHFTHIAAGSV